MLSVEGSSGPIVIDIGTSNIRGGFAGGDRPSVVERTIRGSNGQDTLFPVSFHKPQPGMQVDSVWKSLPGSGAQDLNDSEILAHVLSGVVSKTRSGSMKSEQIPDVPLDNAVLISEPSLQNNTYRQKVIQMLFEDMGCRGAFVSKRSVLSAFSAGKITGLVVSVGAGVTNVSCIAGGHSNAHFSAHSGTAGNVLDSELLSQLQEQYPNMSTLPESFKTVTCHPSFAEQAQRHYARVIKEEVCRVAESDELRVTVSSSSYMLPDGTRIDCSKVSQSIPELLFKDKDLGISALVGRVIDKCRTSDTNLVTSLLNSVFICGGTSSMPGFTERVQNDLRAVLGKEVKCVYGKTSSEKQHSAWIGGSIVASLGNFSSLWITKREYEEHGIGIVAKKCP